MQASEIRLEIARIVKHDIGCATRRKDPGECNCSQPETVDELDTLVYRLLRGIR
jgi:hypothetical protein